jgi:hypothetical protein
MFFSKTAKQQDRNLLFFVTKDFYFVTLTNSPCNDQDIVDQVAGDSNSLIGGKNDSCLLIDETASLKKGTSWSVSLCNFGSDA